jgi:hypothetical protein
LFFDNHRSCQSSNSNHQTKQKKQRPARCDPSAQCLDTEQSYECVCAQGFEGEGSGRCGGKASTADCCAGGEACKHAFVCVPSTAKDALDGCLGQCVKDATCVQLSKERDLWECRCHDDLFGNGKHCFGGGPPPPAIFDRRGNLQGKILAADYCGWCVFGLRICLSCMCFAREKRCVCFWGGGGGCWMIGRGQGLEASSRR